jgi:integrase
MNALKKGIRDYVRMRQSLGYKLERHQRLLPDFASFLQKKGTQHITVAKALEWARSRPNAQPAAWAHRLSCVRGFARYWIATDPQTEIPAQGLLPYRYGRARPYLYTEDEIRSLLRAARKMEGFSGLTFSCFFGLLAVTGLRVSEARNLRPDDVDLDEGVLLIASTKFRKSRLVPIHASTKKVLANYARERDQIFGRELPFYFVSSHGTRLVGSKIRRTFYKLSRQTGLRGPKASHGPRIHDFRHRFAVATLINWYRSALDVESRLPVLSTYLGHVRVSDTYWYLSTCPELMGLAVQRLEKHWEERA